MSSIYETCAKVGPCQCSWCGSTISIKKNRLHVEGGDDPNCLCHVSGEGKELVNPKT